MQNPAKFREYAEECKRLAKTAANEKDRIALLEIAEAWLACSLEAERKNKRDGRKALSACARQI
jgi:hypothetical protein